jgi:glucose-6-phosphate isomerase
MLIVAMKGEEYNYKSEVPMNLHFLSNTDSDYFEKMMKKIELSKTIMVNMSKSGSTSETSVYIFL